MTRAWRSGSWGRRGRRGPVRRGATLAVVALVLALAACSTTTTTDAGPPATAASPGSTGPRATTPGSTGPGSTSSGPTASTVGTAVGLRTDLSGLLAEHAVLVTSGTDAILAGRAGEAEAAAAELGRNAERLAEAVIVTGDADQRAEFEDGWQRYTNWVLDYARAAGSGDEAGAGALAAKLAAYPALFADFFADVYPDVDHAELVALLTERVTSMTSLVDAQSAGQHDRAAESLGTALAGSGAIGGVLASAAADTLPELVVGDPTAASAEAQVNLAQLLADDAGILSLMTDALLAGREAQAIALQEVLGARSIELLGALDAAGTAIDTAELEAQLVARQQALFRYGEAVRGGTGYGPESVDAARAALVDQAGALAGALAGGQAPPPDLTTLAAQATDSLVHVLDAQVVKDWTAAYDGVVTGVGVAGALAATATPG